MLCGAVVDGQRMRDVKHRRLRWAGDRSAGGVAVGGSRFALRLALSFAATLLVVGVAGYLYLDRELRASQIKNLAAAQRSDGKTFELYGARSRTRAQAIARIAQVMDDLSRREGTLEVLLIGPDGAVRASGTDTPVGARGTDVHIRAALRQGASYAGQEAAKHGNGADFEFVTPVKLRGESYAFEVGYDHNVLDAQLSDIRHGLVLVGLFALLVFYLFGGRALLRSHRAALRRATRDGLTDLPNHRAFQDELPLAVAAAVRNQEALALVALDVDDFKLINDRHGHPHGDAVLRRVAEVLRAGRPGDRAYRVGGDEFVVLLPHTDSDGARVLARRLLRSLDDAKLEVTVGISASRPDQPGDHLREEADAALYEAKRRGGNQFAHFDDIRERVAVISPYKRTAVRRLIEEQRLTTVYQPIRDLSRDTLIGLEALTRPDPELGLSGPAEAFDIAEQIGRVHDLDIVCTKHSLASAPDLPEGALLFLNLCPSTLDLDADGDDWLRTAVEQSGLPVERIVIEVTERFAGRTGSTIKCLQRLQTQGFKFAIDDVGTGNSGLAMLRQIKVEYVKIDRTIVTAAPTEPGARAVLMAIATYARQTGAFVIAEGIQDNEALQFLRSLDQHELHTNAMIQGGQGYALGRPEANPQAIPQEPTRHLPEAA
jgi:diguanylate cyclase (GGDEF)-like protein